MNTIPSTEDRIWAVLSHLSALAFGMGILLPIISWSEQRCKSKYASFQCLQALGYQSLGYTIWLLSYLVVMIVLLVIFAIAVGAAGDDSTLITAWTGIFVFIAFGLFGIYILLPIIAAIACAFGKDFRYPMMGNRLAKYLGYPQTDDKSAWLVEEHEDRWVAAMGHFSIIILLWGLIAPLSTWILQGKRSLFLKFQSIQTLVYQVGVTILYFGAVFVYMFGFFAFIAATGLAGGAENGSPTGMLSLIIFIVFSLLAFAVILFVPLLHILGQWAGFRVLKGDDYRYPLIGRLVENWIAQNISLKEKTS